MRNVSLEIEMNTFTTELDADGILTCTFDVPGKSMNTLTSEAIADLGALAARIKTDDAVKGAVFTSGKSSGFCAGADLSEFAPMFAGAITDGEAGKRRAFDMVLNLSMTFRAIEACGKPVGIATAGLTLGGGCEWLLACHYRAALDSPKVQIGLPEVKVGIMPGAGGTQRLTRIMGAMAALPYLLEGKNFSAQDALAAGVLQSVSADPVAACKDWIKAGGKAVVPWDADDFKIPGGAVQGKAAQVFMVGNAMLRQKTYDNYPGARHIMSAVYEGLQLPFVKALELEVKYFLRTVMTPQSSAMVRSLFLSMQDLNKGARRPTDVPEQTITCVAVIGAGFMGAGIAHAAASAGIKVVLVDATQEGADKGRKHSEDLLAKATKRGKMTAEKAAEILERIVATTDYELLWDADLVIEAVFEKREVKDEVITKAEAHMRPDTIFGTNTSTLPVSGLATSSVRPDQFIGIHFFSPVDKMMLVEIIKGEKTGDVALARAMDFVMRLKKTPIVVRDARGFYANRCVLRYIEQGMNMLDEGLPPALIENVAKQAGMPVGPLSLQDEVAIDLGVKIVRQTAADLGDAYKPGATDRILIAMAETHGRLGRKNAKGFYDYPEGGEKTLWPGLKDLVANHATTWNVDDIRDRILYAQAIEAARSFADKIVTDVREADVGSILGWGFAPWSGGVLSFIDMVGPAAFVKRADELAAQYGPVFIVPQTLRQMAERGEGYYSAARAPAAV